MLVIQQGEYSDFISYYIKHIWKLCNYALIAGQRMALLDRPLGK